MLIVLLLVSSSYVGLSISSTGIGVEKTYAKPLYTTHDPIYINGNDNFTGENGVTGGLGTSNDPYIIGDWVIEGDSSTSTGIFVNNTNVYFIIRNCTVYNFYHTDEYHSGIKLSYVENGMIENSSVFKSHTCINIRYSVNTTIINCSCYDFPYLYGYGINCYRSKYITIKSCECYNLYVGVDLSKSSDIIIENTNCYNNTLSGLDSFAVEPTTMHLVIKDCKFYENKWHGIRLSEREFHPSYSQIVNCEFFNNGIETKVSALSIDRLCDNIIENCSFHHNWKGIGITTERNIIRNCSVFNNMRQGISIYGYVGVRAFTKFNKIVNCNIYNNSIGIQFWTSIGSVAENCNIYNNSWHGIYNGMFSMVRIKHNNIYDNGYDEMFEAPCGMWSMWFCFVDARDNWWGSENGPRMYRFGYLGIIPIKIIGNEKIIRSRSIIMYRPWAKEPIPDAGVRLSHYFLV